MNFLRVVFGFLFVVFVFVFFALVAFFLSFFVDYQGVDFRIPFLSFCVWLCLVSPFFGLGCAMLAIFLLMLCSLVRVCLSVFFFDWFRLGMFLFVSLFDL